MINPNLIGLLVRLEIERLILEHQNYQERNKVVHEAINESYKELRPCFSCFRTIPTVEETELALREAHAKFYKRERFYFLIFHKRNKDFIRMANFEDINWNVSKSKIGYWIHTKYSCKGIC